MASTNSSASSSAEPFPSINPGDNSVEYFAHDYVSVMLIIIGFYLWFFGYNRYKPGSKARTWIERIHWLFTGYAFGAMIMLQVQYYALTNVAGSATSNRDFNAMLVGVVPAALSLLIIFMPGLGILALGIQISLLLAQAFTLATWPTALGMIIPRDLLITSIGFLGGLFLVLLDAYAYHLIAQYFMAAAGASFIMEGLSCFFADVPILRAWGHFQFLYTCNPTSTSNVEIGIYYAVVFGGALVGVAIQTFWAKIFNRVKVQKKKEERPELENIFQKLNRPKVKGMKPSLWHFVRHSGEYLSFRTHLKQLGARLDELHLNERELKAQHPYADDSQYVALADQISHVTKKKITPAELHAEVIKWLDDKPNWDVLASQPDDLFEMKGLTRIQWCEKMKEDFWGDYITLQAAVQIHQIPINVISSIWDPPIIEFPILHQKKKATQKNKRMKENPDKIKSLKIGVQYIVESEIDDDVPDGVVTLVGYDNKAVRVDKNVAMRSTTLQAMMTSAEDQKVVRFPDDKTLTGEALFRICKQLEAFYILEKNEAALDDIDEKHLAFLDVAGYFGANAKPKIIPTHTNGDTNGDASIDRSGSSGSVPEVQPVYRPLLLSHYWGFHYGSLEASAKPPPNTVLPSIDTQMRTEYRPAGRIAVNRCVIVLIMLTGVWWVLWQCVWGYRFKNVIVGIEFVIFVICEATNLALASIYNFNFWNPVYRRWKSLDRLNPIFRKNIIVNSMIFHYSEDVKDTQRTIDGSLRMKSTENCTIRVYVCDDGFWNYPPKPEAVVQKKIHVGKYQRLKNYLTNTTLEEEVLEEVAQVQDPLVPKPLPVAKSNYKPMFGQAEEQLLDRAVQLYRVRPKDVAKDMLAMMKQTMYRYYSEKLHCRVNVQCRVNLRTNVDNEIYRGDCAQATMAYYFSAEYLGKIAGPECILVARIKPDVHHYKAGNINNALFNERLEGQFAILLDNDMKPTKDFVVRTVPWFYFYNELERKYKMNHAMSFVQSPQFFKASTIGEGHDFLGGRNGVFFQGIQVGRDGYDLCAFAGTNAIFRLRAMHTVNGLPYGSLTEDAHLAICLHRMGYKSVYVEDRLAIGLAPVTVANSMQQRSRWVKGSVQIFQLYALSCGPRDDHVIWHMDNPFKKDTKRQILEHGCPIEERTARNFFRTMFFWDTMMYPFSALTAILYMVVAFIFLITGEPPLDFTRPPFYFQAFLITFLPYFALKFCQQYLSYNKVKADDVWVSQEIWFGYSFASLIGVVDALKEQITGQSLGGWGVTGEGRRSSNLEWFNVIVCLAMALIIFIRFVVFLIDPTNVVSVAAIFFAITIVIQMWPMVSTSLFEMIMNSVRERDEMVDLQRFELPNYIVFTAVLIGGILLSVFALGAGTISVVT